MDLTHDAFSNVNFLRGKLIGKGADQYQKELERQNSGERCNHCGSDSGHYAYCPLINRQSAEAASFVDSQFSEFDLAFARDFHIKLV